GYDENSRPLDTPDKREVAKQLFKHTMASLSEGKETKDFEKPSSVVEVGVEKGTNPPELPSDYTPSDNIVTELFVKGTEPSKTSKEYDKIEAVKNLKADYNEKKE